MRHSRISEEAAEPPSEPAVASGAASEAGSGPPSPPLRSATDSELPPSARTMERQSSEEQPATPGRAERRCSFHAMGQTVLGSIRMRRALAERIDIHMPFGTLQMTELLAACANGEAERVANIIQLTRSTHGEEGLKVELESTDDWAGSGALHWAAYSGKVEVVRLVVAAGAKHDATNSRDASTPLHLAARYGKAPVVKELAEAAPHVVSVKNDMGNTPLHEAAYQGMWEATEELLRAGGSTEVRNNEAKGGITPLLAAVAFGRLLTVRSLLKGGADPTAMPRAAEVLFRKPVDSGKNGVRRHSLPREMPPAMMKARSLGRLPSSSKGLAADKEEAAKPSLGKMPSVGRMLGSFNWSDPFSAPNKADPRRSRRVSVTSASGGATVLAVMTSYGTFEDWVVPNHGALSVALACGELEIVSELLMWGWRNKKVMAVLTREQVEKTVLNVWTAKECIVKEKDREIVGTSQMIAEEEAETRLFTLLTLSCKVTADGAETLAEASDQPDSDRSSFVAPKLPLDENAQNPVEIAVSLSVLCCKEANVFTRDMRTMRRLLRAASSFEHVACGLVHGASIAAAQADEDRQYNPWKMGKEKISPSEVLEEFVRRPLENAAQHNCKIFISQPLVYAHMQDMYWPMRSHASPDDELSAWQVFSLQAVLLTANLLAVPLLPFLPRSWEHSMEEELRTQLSKSPIPYGLVWLLPAGRLALWFISCFGIACILTTMPPVLDGDTGWPWSWDLMLLLFVLGIIEGEADEVWRGGLYAYTRDPFNVLDVSAVITMLIMLVCRFLMLTFNPEDAVVAGESVIEEVGITFQAFAALSVWLRMLQMLNLSPTSGPMLLMAMRMMQDLKEFLKPAMLVVVAFGSAFFVLVHAATRRLEAQREHSSSYEEEEGSRREAANKLFSALIQGVLNSEPADVIAALPNSTVAWGLMLFFGVVVVLLLLNLLIARFAKTFDLVSESVDEVFKLAFARIVLAGREMELAPRPLNLVRRLVDLVASCACFCNIDTVKYVDLAHLSSPESPTHARDAAHHVREFSAFIERAISPDVKLYPEQVEEYVRKHRQDMNTEERWRYMLNAKVNELQLSMYYWQNSQHVDKREAKIDGEAKQREIATLQSLVRNMPAEVAKRCGGSGKQSFVPMEPVSPTRSSDAAGAQLSARLKALEGSTASKLGSLSASIEQMEGRIEATLVERLAAMQPQTVVATNVRLEGEPASLRRTDSDDSLKI